MVELYVAVMAWTMFHRHVKHLSPSSLVAVFVCVLGLAAIGVRCVHEFMYDAFSVYANNNEFGVRITAMASQSESERQTRERDRERNASKL